MGHFTTFRRCWKTYALFVVLYAVEPHLIDLLNHIFQLRITVLENKNLIRAFEI